MRKRLAEFQTRNAPTQTAHKSTLNGPKSGKAECKWYFSQRMAAHKSA